jgi:Tat protein secretion system quality control protein TatD with DNase activity
MGLDYHYNFSEVEIQQTVFRKQLQSAEMLRLPVVLHTREAEQDTLRILEEHPVSRKGVAHSFTGSQKMADALLAMGCSSASTASSLSRTPKHSGKWCIPFRSTAFCWKRTLRT